MILSFKFAENEVMAYKLSVANLFIHVVHNDSLEVCQDIPNWLW